MKTLIKALCAALLLFALPFGLAQAEIFQARVVLSCGQAGFYSSALVSRYSDLTVDLTGTLCTAGGSGGAITSTVSPSDTRQTFSLDATKTSGAGSFVDIPLNGQGVVALKFSGLTASGATITYYSSNDASTAPTSPISALNASTGVTSGTRTADGETRIPIAGRTTLRLQVTSAGTGTITGTANVAGIAVSGIVDIGSPLLPGGNAIGSVFGVTAPGAAPAGNGLNPFLNGFLDGGGLARTVSPTNPMPMAEQGSSASSAGIAPVVATGTAAVGKASAGNLYSAYAVNTTATFGYLACIDAIAAPSAGAAISPKDVAALPGSIGGTAQINFGPGPGDVYATGITCLVTTSLTTYTAGGSSFINVRVR